MLVISFVFSSWIINDFEKVLWNQAFMRSYIGEGLKPLFFSAEGTENRFQSLVNEVWGDWCLGSLHGWLAGHALDTLYARFQNSVSVFVFLSCTENVEKPFWAKQLKRKGKKKEAETLMSKILFSFPFTIFSALYGSKLCEYRERY